jgi:hypothetical protein
VLLSSTADEAGESANVRAARATPDGGAPLQLFKHAVLRALCDYLERRDVALATMSGRLIADVLQTASGYVAFETLPARVQVSTVCTCVLRLITQCVAIGAARAIQANTAGRSTAQARVTACTVRRSGASVHILTCAHVQLLQLGRQRGTRSARPQLTRTVAYDW